MKKKLGNILLALSLAISMTACGQTGENAEVIQEEIVSAEKATELDIEGASYILLADEEISIDGKSATTDTKEAVYVANDIVYYEEGKDFTYGAGGEADAHSKEEAQRHTVVHITQPGIYVVSGKLSAGQIAVDLGEEAKDNPEAVVTLVLNNLEIQCDVAPGIIFYNVYECCSSEEEEAVKDVDTSAAGANIIIADGSVNTVTGSYVAKIYKSVELNEDGTEVTDSKKLHKYDGAFYSKMSMNVNGGEIGDGILNIYAQNEGLDSELHLTINGGNIRIVSGNDGINTNEDNVSVTTINGGYLSIMVDGATKEGDGIDSNGWIVINGGVITAAACADSMDSGLDADRGIYINGGTVAASGTMYDKIEAGNQNFVVFSFQESIKAETEIILKQAQDSFSYQMPNDFTYLVISGPELTEGEYTLWQGETQLSVVKMQENFGGPGREGSEGEPPEIPDDRKTSERPEMPEEEMGNPPQMPEDMTMDERAERQKKEEMGNPPEMPQDMKPGERPEMPEGMDMGEIPQKPFGVEQINTDDAKTEFDIGADSHMFYVLNQQSEK